MHPDAKEAYLVLYRILCETLYLMQRFKIMNTYIEQNLNQIKIMALNCYKTIINLFN